MSKRVFKTKPTGRPKTGCQVMPIEVQDAIINWLSNGKTLREFCRQDGMPSFVSVYEFKNSETGKSFAERFAKARDAGFDVIADESLAIVDEVPMMETVGDGWVKRQVDPAGVQRNRVRAEHRLKLLAKWNPTKYGEKLAHVGANGGPITFVLERITAPPSLPEPPTIDAEVD